ncbi:LpqN/LpqT family lipoprotein [Mycobacterium sp. NPDC050853]|uniref:LpqN/LpqT family lipoprotein n=1 Tax=Mycobacterium sp. NPDC050853 TaxID=3155160 RepID=UPI0033C3EA60
MTASAARCAANDTPLVILDSKAADEPKLAIPTPQGWAYTAAMNSPVIRGAIANTALRANGFTPNAVVTLEDLTGKVASAQQGVDAEPDAERYVKEFFERLFPGMPVMLIDLR